MFETVANNPPIPLFVHISGQAPSKPRMAMVGTIDHGVTAHYVQPSTPTPIKTKRVLTN